MLTIKGTYGQQLILGIPNNNVRMQYYNFLLENYSPVCDINTKELVTMFSHMAFDGNWHDALSVEAQLHPGTEILVEVGLYREESSGAMGRGCRANQQLCRGPEGGSLAPGHTVA